MIFTWLRRRAEARARIERDATELIAEFGEEAYFEAAYRHGQDIEAAGGRWPSDHWRAVGEEIRRRTGHPRSKRQRVAEEQ